MRRGCRVHRHQTLGLLLGYRPVALQRGVVGAGVGADAAHAGHLLADEAGHRVAAVFGAGGPHWPAGGRSARPCGAGRWRRRTAGPASCRPAPSVSFGCAQ